MADLTESLAVSLAGLYAGKVIKGMPAFWDPNDLLRAEPPARPAKTFMSMHPEHAFTKFLVQFEKHYREAARGSDNHPKGQVADLPFIGGKVLSGERPVVVISQRSYAPRPGSVSLWAMLFPFGPTAPEEYATTPEWKVWRSKYPKYQQVLCGSRAVLSFGLDPDLLVVTDACLPRGCGDERAFLNKFIEALPAPRMILSLGGGAANRLGMEDRWHRLREEQKKGQTIDPSHTTANTSNGVPIVVSPFAWGNNAKDFGGLHFTAAVDETRFVLK